MCVWTSCGAQYSYTRREAGEPRLLSTAKFAMIKIGQTKHSATVIRLNFVFAHDDGLLMPQDWNYGTDRLGGASMALNSGGRGFERYRLVSPVDWVHNLWT